IGPEAVTWAPWYAISQPSGVASGGVARPILPASHHAPSRASIRRVWSPQWRRSGEYEIQMLAEPRSGDGRWIMAHRPPMRTGRRAASLSSGGMTGPSRRASLKSFVTARDTSGPRLLYAV